MTMAISGSGSAAITNRGADDATAVAENDAAPVTQPVVTAQTGFDTNAAAVPDDAPVEASAVTARQTEIQSLVGDPSTLQVEAVVQPQTKLDTIAQAAKPEEREAVIAHFRTARSEDVDAAFKNVLAASITQGTRPVALGPFVGQVTVQASGAVNGAALPSDREVTAAARLSNLSLDDKRAELAQVGVDTRWLHAARPEQLTATFFQVEMQRQFGGPGERTLTTPTAPRTIGQTLSYQVTADGSLVKPGGQPQRPASEAALTRIGQRESAEWPAGTPEAREKRRIEDTGLEVPLSEKVDTLAQVLPPESAAQLRELLARNDVEIDTASIDRSYQSVLAARTSPGEKQVDVRIETFRTESCETEGGTQTNRVPVETRAFTATMNVAADGSVNGKPLGVDQLAKLGSQCSTLPPDVKNQALADAGLSADWLQHATDGQKDFALAKLRQASTEPGPHTLDLSYDATLRSGGESETVENHHSDGRLSFTAGADGKVNGKTPLVEVALATQLTMERMPMAEKRMLLAQTGFPLDACRDVRPDEAASILTRVAMATRTPGEHRLDVTVGGAEWQLGLKVGARGDIEGAGAAKVPKENGFKQFLGVVFTVMSFIPPVAWIGAIGNLALAVDSGATGLRLFAAVAGAAAGLGQVTGAMSASTVATLQTASRAMSAVEGVRSGLETGNYLGVFAAAISLADSAGTLTGSPLDASFDVLKLAGTGAGLVDALHQGDPSGILSGAFGVAQGVNQLNTTTTPAATGTDYSLTGGRFGESGTSTVRLGTGDDGASLTPATDTTDGVRPGTVTFDDDGEPGGSTLRPVTGTGGVTAVDGTVEVRPTSRVIAAGDTLSRIAAQTMGDANKWPELYAYNVQTLGGRDPNQIRVGTELQIPPADFALPTATRNALFNAAHITPPAPVTTGAGGLQVVDFDLGLAADATSFASMANGSALPGTVLGGTRLGEIVDSAIAFGNSLPDQPASRTSWESFKNGAVNTVGLLNDAVSALIPGTTANQRVSGAMVEFVRDMGTLAGQVAADPKAALDATERFVGKFVGTVMDPRRWGEGGSALLGTVVHATFDNTVRLAERMGQDPSTIPPGQLALDALGAAVGLSNLLLVGQAKNAVGGVANTVMGGFRAEATVGGSAAADVAWRGVLETHLGSSTALADTTFAARNASTSTQFAGAGLDLENALFHGTHSSSLMGITSGEGLISLGGLRAQGRVPFGGELSGWGTAANPTFNANASALSTFTGADLNLGLAKYAEGFNSAAWTPEISNARIAQIDSMPALERAQMGFNREVELQRQAAWQNLTPAQRQLVSDPFPMLVEMSPAATRPAGDFAAHTLPDWSGRGFATEITVEGGVTSREIGTLFVPADRIPLVQQMLAESGQTGITVRALEPLQTRAVDPIDLVTDLRRGGSNTGGSRGTGVQP